MPELTVGSEKIFYEEAGSPTGKGTFVFVHGAGESSYAWSRQLDTPPPGYRCIAIDLPGRGQSGRTGRDTIEGYVDVLGKFLEARVSGPFILVGHSMGGAVVQIYTLTAALTAPPGGKGPKAIVLVGTGARLRVAPMVFASLEGDFRAAIELSTSWAFSEKTSPEVIQTYIRETVKGTAVVMIGDFRACDSFDVMDRIRGISLPTLIVCGEDDKLTPPKYSRFLHEKIAGSQMEIIQDAGHMVMLEKPREFSECLAKFLRSAG